MFNVNIHTSWYFLNFWIASLNCCFNLSSWIFLDFWKLSKVKLIFNHTGAMSWPINWIQIWKIFPCVWNLFLRGSLSTKIRCTSEHIICTLNAILDFCSFCVKLFLNIRSFVRSAQLIYQLLHCRHWKLTMCSMPNVRKKIIDKIQRIKLWRFC